MKTTVHRNTSAAGVVTYHASESIAREAVRNRLRAGEPPFSEIAVPVAVPSGRKALAAFLTGLSAPR